MATNREAAEESLKAIAVAGLMTAGDFDAAGFSAKAGIIAALLDIADAVRDQSAAIREQTDGLQNWGIVVR